MAESKMLHIGWRLMGSASIVQLPSIYNEIFIKVTPSASGGNWYRTIMLPKATLTNSLVEYLTGDYAGAYGSCRVSIYASSSEVRLNKVYDNGNDVTSSSAMYVYVR